MVKGMFVKLFTLMICVTLCPWGLADDTVLHEVIAEKQHALKKDSHHNFTNWTSEMNTLFDNLTKVSYIVGRLMLLEKINTYEDIKSKMLTPADQKKLDEHFHSKALKGELLQRLKS